MKYINLTLQKINLRSNEIITDIGINHLYNLKKLTCGQNNNLTDKCLINKKLTKLYCPSYNHKFTNIGIKYIYKTLEVLSFDYNCNITDKIIPKLINLKKLYLGRNHLNNITHKSIIELKKLDTLDISECSNVLLTKKLLDNLPNLIIAFVNELSFSNKTGFKNINDIENKYKNLKIKCHEREYY
jgi:hypothetical protein